MSRAIPAILALLAGATAAMSSPAPVSVEELHNRLLASIERSEQPALLNRIARTAPRTPRDASALFDLFSRFPEAPVRAAVMSSVHLASAQDRALEAPFLNYLRDESPEAVIFGINGVLALRSEEALPLIRDIAKRKFPARSALDLDTIEERNRWWIQYEALSALAQWEGASARPLLKRKAKEAPAVAGLLARYLWEESLADFAAWSKGGSREREMARLALETPVEPSRLRPTREAMLKLARDPKSDKDLRHQLALKAGFCSTEQEVAALLEEQAQTVDAQTKLLLAAAAFASRSTQTAGLLATFAREDPSAAARAGALLQLREMLPPESYRPHLEWAARNDPDPENKEEAQRQLKLLKK